MSVKVSYEKEIAGVTERWIAEGETDAEAVATLARMLPAPRYQRNRDIEKAIRTLQEPHGVGRVPR